MSTAPTYRAMRYGITRVRLDDTPHGVQYVQAEQALQAHDPSLCDQLLSTMGVSGRDMCTRSYDANLRRMTK